MNYHCFAGKHTGLVFEGEKRFDLAVKLHSGDRRSLNDAQNLLVPAPTGTQVLLYQVADVQIINGPNQIQRENSYRRIVVGFNVRGRDVQGIVNELQQKVNAQLKLPSGYYGKRYDYAIILIGKHISPERTVDVHCHFENFDNSSLPGADIEENNTEVFAVPEDAVVNFEAKDYVFVETGHNSFGMVPVATGISEKSFIGIKNADALQGKQIVIKGAYTFLMKLKNRSEDEE